MIGRFKKGREQTKHNISIVDAHLRDAMLAANLTKPEAYKLKLARSLIIEIISGFNQETRDWIERDTRCDCGH